MQAARRSLRAVALASRRRLLSMSATASSSSLQELLTRSIPLLAHTQQEMEQIGAQVAKNRCTGDVIFLKGYACVQEGAVHAPEP